MDRIAEHAGVAVQTLSYTFRTKGQLLCEVVEVTAAGDQGAPCAAARLGSGHARGHPCQRVLALAVEHGVDIFVRAAPLWPAVAEAAGDPFVARYWRDVAAERRAGQARMVAKLAELDEHRATDIVVVLFGHDGYRRLVGEASWSVPEYKTWLLTLVQQLCIGPS